MELITCAFSFAFTYDTMNLINDKSLYKSFLLSSLNKSVITKVSLQ